MKVALSKVASGIVMVSKIKELNLGVPVDYWCTKNINILSEDYKYFIKKLNEIYEKYCFKGEDGQYCWFDDNSNTIFNLKEGCDVDKLNEEIKALFEYECEITPFVMSMNTWETLPNFQIDGGDSGAIDFLLP